MTWANELQNYRERAREEREKRLASQGLSSIKPTHTGVYAPVMEAVTAIPKPHTYRDPALLEMAQGRPCLLMAVENCELAGGTTTVACHQNEGKGVSLKQSDAKSVWGCAPCHEWLDRSGAPKAEKRRVFMGAHLRQVLAWREIVADASEPERNRKAAQRALDELNATPVVRMEDV